MLMLAPLYDRMESAQWKRLTLRAAMILTLSRSVWAGMIIEQVLSMLVLFGSQFRSFPVVYFRSTSRRVAALALTIAVIMSSLLFNAQTVAFVLDPTFGGRTDYIRSANHFSFLPEQPVNSLAETVLYSAADRYGITGFFALTLIFVLPLFIAAFRPQIMKDTVRRAAFKGLVLYLIIMNVDGGIGYIPIMVFYWFIYMVFVYGLPFKVLPEAQGTLTVKRIRKRRFRFGPAQHPAPGSVTAATVV